LSAKIFNFNSIKSLLNKFKQNYCDISIHEDVDPKEKIYSDYSSKLIFWDKVISAYKIFSKTRKEINNNEKYQKDNFR
jgi:hypothetical protein